MENDFLTKKYTEKTWDTINLFFIEMKSNWIQGMGLSYNVKKTFKKLTVLFNRQINSNKKEFQGILHSISAGGSVNSPGLSNSSQTNWAGD